MKLTTEKIGEARIDIEVDGAGKFSADFNDQTYTGKTLEELTDKLHTAVKKAAQQGSVLVTVLGIVVRKTKHMYRSDVFEEGVGFVHAKLRAKHERQYNSYLLVTDDDRMATKKFQVNGRSDGTICRRLSAAEAVGYVERALAAGVAAKVLEDFIGDVKLDADKALADARKS